MTDLASWENYQHMPQYLPFLFQASPENIPSSSLTAGSNESCSDVDPADFGEEQPFDTLTTSHSTQPSPEEISSGVRNYTASQSQIPETAPHTAHATMSDFSPYSTVVVPSVANGHQGVSTDSSSAKSSKFMGLIDLNGWGKTILLSYLACKGIELAHTLADQGFNVLNAKGRQWGRTKVGELDGIIHAADVLKGEARNANGGWWPVGQWSQSSHPGAYLVDGPKQTAPPRPTQPDWNRRWRT